MFLFFLFYGKKELKTLPNLDSQPPLFEVKRKNYRFGLPEIFIPC